MKSGNHLLKTIFLDHVTECKKQFVRGKQNFYMFLAKTAIENDYYSS